MKKIIILIFAIFILLIPNFSFAEDIDVVYLKNGSIIRGKIIENVINKNLKIELQDGSVMVFEYDDIEKTAVVEAPSTQRVTGNQLKSPGGALALSLVPPIILPIQGLGQFYNGEAGKGAAFLVTGIISAGMLFYGIAEETTYYDSGYYSYEETQQQSSGAAGLGAIIYLGSWIWSSIDAYSSAKKINLANNYQKTFDITFKYYSSPISKNYPQICLSYKF
ncbi:hypothetical protein ACFL6H_07340 [Candidatus Latescibacterota bacterium]